MKAILLGGGARPVVLAARHPCGDPLLQPARLRPGDPRRRPHQPPHQARHAHHGRRASSSLGTLLGYFARRADHPRPTPRRPALLLLFLFVGMGLVGLPRRLHQGLQAAQPRPAQQGEDGRPDRDRAGLRLLALSHTLPTAAASRPASDHLSFIRDTEIGCRRSWRSLLFWVIDRRHSNAVNLTDGLDGLATGAWVMVFGAYMFVNIWQNNQNCAIRHGPACYEVRDPLDLAVVAAAITGACFGFLWWNAPPAQIFMGDTGSLSLGGALAGLAILTRTELLLVIIGGLFVVDHAVGDPAGRASSRLATAGSSGPSSRRAGHRVFRMAPLQHHFELLGWEQVTVVIRFWIIAGLCVAAGLGVFYAEWVAVPSTRETP